MNIIPLFRLFAGLFRVLSLPHIRTLVQQCITDVIKNLNISIYNPIRKVQLTGNPSLKSDSTLFSHLYIASIFHESNLEGKKKFFSHENQPLPFKTKESSLISKKKVLHSIILVRKVLTACHSLIQVVQLPSPSPR